MEEDLTWFVILLEIISVPLFTIFLTLSAVKWNERKSLVFNRWFVYLAWVIFGLTGFFVALTIEKNFPVTNNILSEVFFFISILVFQTCGVAAVLFRQNHPGKDGALPLLKEAALQTSIAGKIWKTAFFISVLNLLIVRGFIAVLNYATTNQIQ